MVCSGAKSVREARKAIMTVAEELKKEGINIAGNPEIKIRNMITSGSLDRPIDFEDFYDHFGEGPLCMSLACFPAQCIEWTALRLFS